MEGKSVLILDDDVDILNLLNIEFKRSAYTVLKAQTSASAIELLDSQPIHAAILDIVLGPNETSDSVIQHIKEHHNPDVRTMPVIITSAHINDQSASKFEQKWDNVYKAISKPFKQGELSKMVTSMLEDLGSGKFFVLDPKEESIEFRAPDLDDEKLNLSDLDTTLVHKEQVEAQEKANAENMARDDINYRNADGQTSLMIFSMKGEVDIAKNLIDLGADTNLQAPNGQTALHLACRHGHYGIVKLLLENGSKLNVKDNEKKEPLFEAILSGNYQTVDLLIRLGSRIDNQVDGKTYLMHAMEMDHASIFNRLLAAGIDPMVKGSKGLTIKQMARQKNLNSYMKILSAMGL